VFLSILGLALGLAHADVDPRPLILISDIDDTVKQTNVGNSSEATHNTVFGAPPFAGLPELYGDLLDSSAGRGEAGNVHLYFVTGTPKTFASFQEKFLNESGFPLHDSRYTGLLGDKDLQAYKIAKISEIVAARPEARFILIGDDTQKDQPALAEVAKRYPGQISARYVHRIRAASNLDGEISFSTSADLALQEFARGDVSLEQLQALAGRFKDWDITHDVLPKFMACPWDHWLSQLRQDLRLPEFPAELQSEIDQFEARVELECFNRQKP
jgi:phosphatidate phosphatase APP1